MRLFTEPWPLGVGALALSLTNFFMFMYAARTLGTFPTMAMWGSWIYNLLGLKTESPFAPLNPIYRDMPSLLNIGIILGTLGTALLAREFKIRKEDWQGYLLGAVGGILMGFGTVLLPSCNLGGFWVATMTFSLRGPLAAIGLLLGAFAGGKILQYQMRKALQNVDFTRAFTGKPTISQTASRQPMRGLMVFGFIFAVFLVYYFLGMPKHGGLFLFGVLVGVIIQRSRLCFTAAFREILISRDGKVMKWVLLSMVVGALGFALHRGQGFNAGPVGWHNIVGGFLFGMGMVLAGGCGLGILVRSGEGYTRSWVAILSGMLTSGAWVHIYGQKVGQGWLYGKPVFLPDIIGWGGALAFVYAFLLVFYLFILWVEAGKYERA
ncbi:YeeE/YedE thiosulfate transporter family protein [Moorella stamsii]|uniref:YeeE/YedE thiosulfate transporter family protein n=1 Tax=Neomoorella stamsii TaxID=1266720 RepID=UPI0006D57614|nr:MULTISPECIES: YeeE/YedE thiosulfate transporter family protein [Moorella]